MSEVAEFSSQAPFAIKMTAFLGFEFELFFVSKFIIIKIIGIFLVGGTTLYL